MVIPIFCSYDDKIASAAKREDQMNPPQNVLCPFCDDIIPSGYYSLYPRLVVCFFCCIPCCHSSPYLACSRCFYPLGDQLSECNRCHVTAVCSTHFCPNCGATKGGGGDEEGGRTLGERKRAAGSN